MVSKQPKNNGNNLGLCKEFFINVALYRIITGNDVEYKEAITNAKNLLKRINKGNIADELIKVGIIGFLNKWRCRYAKEKSSKIKEFLRKNKIKDYLNKLNSYSLKDIAENPEGVEIREKIKGIYQKIRDEKLMGPTCASKFLHILFPKLFVMWDDNIRKKYKEDYNEEIKDNGKGYYKYLVKMNKIKESLESECSKIGIQPNVEKYLNDKFGFDYTIAKYLDEYNWVKYNYIQKIEPNKMGEIFALAKEGLHDFKGNGH